MKKIVFIARRFFPEVGGIQTYTYEVALHLSRLGHEVTVLCPQMPDTCHSDTSQPFQVIRIRGANLKWVKVLFFTLAYLKTVLRTRPDITFATIWAPCGLTAFIGKLLTGVPYFVGFYGTEIGLWRKKPFMESLIRLITRHSEFALACSRFTAQQLISLGIPEARLHVVLCGVDLHRFHPDIPATHQEQRPVLLSLAALIPRKGIDMVIRALPRVKHVHPEILYRVIGKGPDLDRLKTLTKECQVEKNVEFLGFLPDDAIPSYYRSCDLFIMPSRQIGEDYEGFGIVFLEANACGKPVIAGNSGGIPDAVIHGKTGLLVSPENPDEIADAILALLKDESLRNKMGANGIAHARQFTWQATTERILECILVIEDSAR